VVGHPAGLAQGEPGQAAALTPEQARRLLSAAGRDAVALASSLDLAASSRLRAAEAMRAAVGPELGPLALEQALLKQRARSKHPAGERLWWTAEALEQASAYDVAIHRAARFTGAGCVLDLGCSVGGDLLPLAAVAPVVGVDLDETRLLLARENAHEVGASVQLVRADVTRLQPSGAVFADPARRAGGRRVFDPRAYTPSLDQVLGWLPFVDALGVKVAPGIDYDVLPPYVEVEVVSLHGDVKEAVIWGGNVRRGSRRTATLLPTGDTLVDDASPPPVRPPGAFLLEPDGAVIRAHLVAELAARLGGWLLDATIAYIAADAPVSTPFGRWYAVSEVMPFGLKTLRTRLRAYDAGPLVVKKRGTAVEPEQLRAQLKLTGSREVTVVLTRAAGKQIAMVVEPVVASL
jgi:SAM-dependent methyltransferase